MPRWFLFLCLLLCGGSTTCAQDTLPPTNTVEIRPFDTQRITSYRADPSLQYDRDLHQQLSWWEQLKAWLKELFSHWFNEGVGAFFSTNLVYVLSAVVVMRRPVGPEPGQLAQSFPWRTALVGRSDSS
ncbi:MAG: hypothetical protein IPG92_18705 [Flavobacteriales bacterium]|nr:hypothetical protein [Flavobacteriales bacterium]